MGILKALENYTSICEPEREQVRVVCQASLNLSATVSLGLQAPMQIFAAKVSAPTSVQPQVEPPPKSGGGCSFQSDLDTFMDSSHLNPAQLCFESVQTRRYIISSYWLVVLLAIPLWWQTTSIDRLALPASRVQAERQQEVFDFSQGCQLF